MDFVAQHPHDHAATGVTNVRDLQERYEGMIKRPFFSFLISSLTTAILMPMKRMGLVDIVAMEIFQVPVPCCASRAEAFVPGLLY